MLIINQPLIMVTAVKNATNDGQIQNTLEYSEIEVNLVPVMD